MDFRHPVEAIIPGAQGRVLAVLAETTAELNLGTLARLAGISQASASRLLPGLVEQGLVERREVPPSSLFRLVTTHVAAPCLLGLSRARDIATAEIGQIARRLPVVPASVIVFGSFARGQAAIDSDIDLVIVRPDSTDEDDDRWTASTEQLRAEVRQLTGNPVEVLEVSESEASRRLARANGPWGDIQRDGIVVHGRSLAELESARRG